MNFIGFLFILATSLFTQAEPFKIIIDPGHGGTDAGAQYYGLREADIVLNVAKLLAKKFSNRQKFTVLLTRETDRQIDLRERAQFANEKKAHLLISIHANATTAHHMHGAEFYFQNQLLPDEEALFLANREDELNDESKGTAHNEAGHETMPPPPALTDIASKNIDVLSILDDLLRNERISRSDRLAQQLLNSWRGSIRTRRHAVRQAPFYLMANTHMPSLLVELGYLSHVKEAQSLATLATQERMAKDLYKGILQFKEVLDKERSPHLH